MSHLTDENSLMPLTNTLICKTEKSGDAHLIKFLLQNHEIKIKPENKEKIMRLRN